MNDDLRAWWWVRQGLDGSLAKAGPAEALEQTGWCRSVGGAGPYLSIFARTGASRERIDADAKALQLHELPSARGCTYVVPASDFGIALRASQGGGDDATIAMARKFLGVTDKEIDKLSRDVVDAVSKKPLDPRELKDALGERVRNLGAEGKKRGTTTTLPLALGKLQTAGAIRRVPVNGRLDQQRYAYIAWKPAPKTDFSEEQLAIELARRFFRWAGPATQAQFSWWSGLGARVAKAAIEKLKLAGSNMASSCRKTKRGSRSSVLRKDRSTRWWRASTTFRTCAARSPSCSTRSTRSSRSTPRRRWKTSARSTISRITPSSIAAG